MEQPYSLDTDTPFFHFQHEDSSIRSGFKQAQVMFPVVTSDFEGIPKEIQVDISWYYLSYGLT